MPETKPDPQFKYLAIRNWSKFQSVTDKHGKTLEGRRRTYILDYCEKETDSEYASLSLLQRYLIDACRRLRGKHGQNLPYDFMWICRQLNVPSKERGNAVNALKALVETPVGRQGDEGETVVGRGVDGSKTMVGRGFLIPTNEQVSVPPKPETPLPIPNTDTGYNFGSVLESIPELTGSEPPQESTPIEFPKSKHQVSPTGDRSSEDNTKNNGKSNNHTIGNPPKPASPRSLLVDRAKLRQPLLNLIWEQLKDERNPPRYMKELMGETPTDHELNELLNKTEDSVDTILAVVKWGVEVSNYWFKTKDGCIRTYIDLGNAYSQMAVSYNNYRSKGAKA